MIRRLPPPWGPRSLIVTITCCPVRRFVTCTFVPSGSERCAAVNWDREKRSPLAVFRPSWARPYQEAQPTCPAWEVPPRPSPGLLISNTPTHPTTAITVLIVFMACPPGGDMGSDHDT